MERTIKRLTELDVLREIAIFLIVFGHVTHISELRNYIWDFHIPIFFFISGFLFQPEKYNEFSNFLKHKVKTQILPYLFFYIVTLCYYTLIESHVRGGGINNQINNRYVLRKLL